MPFFLKILSAPNKEKIGMKIPLREGEHMLGRASPPCDIQLESTKVSKKHCLIRLEGKELSAEDLNSANGVYINGKRITKVKIEEKDRLVIGEFILEVTVDK